jgi:perosamine synthetase
MIPIARPLIGEEEKQAVLEVLGSGQLAQGPRVAEFESAFAEFCGVKHAIATTSGTTALQVALMAHGIHEGDEVITSAFSFVASANTIRAVGAKPIFADIEHDYFTLDPESIREKLTPSTRALTVVHLYGQACDMDSIAQIAEEHGLAIIEDACQAHGAAYGGRVVGAHGTACYSFYPTKNMTTAEGGMITTNSDEIADRARMLRNHGGSQRYQHEVMGYNFRMTEMQAAIGFVQLKKLPGWNEIRRGNARMLDEGLEQVRGIATPKVRPGATHVFHQYTIRTKDRDALLEALKAQGIGFGIHYPQPIYSQPLYRELGYQDYLEVSEKAAKEVVSLPVHPSLQVDDIRRIVDTVREATAVAL